jgi:hypothetical protein
VSLVSSCFDVSILVTFSDSFVFISLLCSEVFVSVDLMSLSSFFGFDFLIFCFVLCLSSTDVSFFSRVFLLFLCSEPVSFVS